MLNYIYDLATDKRKGSLDSFFKFFLYLLALLYALLVRLLIIFGGLFVRKSPCRVISVGNITLGGTGKTSLVEYIAGYLKKEGKKVAIASRGYKRKYISPQIADPSYRTMGDEPYMLFKNLKDVPVVVNRNRLKAIDEAIGRHQADTVILDDGFQQWKVGKDLEIVTIDATDPFGNQNLLPRGILRQPLSTLNRADILVITKTNLNPDIQDIKTYLERINPQAVIVEAVHNPLGFFKLGEDRQSLISHEVLKDEKFGILSGIADPDSFENLIRSLGMNPEISFSFPDHHNYLRVEIKEIIVKSKEKNITRLITTEKEAVKIIDVLDSKNCPINFYVLRIKLEIIQDEIFLKRIRSIY